jgi:hypothetical protein
VGTDLHGRQRQRQAGGGGVMETANKKRCLGPKQYGDECRYQGSGPDQPQHQKQSFPVHQPIYGWAVEAAISLWGH